MRVQVPLIGFQRMCAVHAHLNSLACDCAPRAGPEFGDPVGNAVLPAFAGLSDYVICDVAGKNRGFFLLLLFGSLNIGLA